MKKFIKGFLLVLLVATLIFATKIVVEMAIENRKSTIEQSKVTPKNDLLIGYQDDAEEPNEKVGEYQLPVPLLNQLADPPLEHGCEVTALSMLLQYYHFDYGKNELAKRINKEDYEVSEGIFGDPDIGFVGDMTGKTPGTSVNVEPVFQLAKEVVKGPYQVVNSTGSKLDDLLEVVQSGSPVWVIATTDYKVPKEDDFVEWPTKNGMKRMLPKHHAAVISGFSQNKVILNDPYGKIVEVDKKTFNDLFEKTNKQSIYIK